MRVVVAVLGLGVLCLAAPGRAQGIDYGALFALHADKVVRPSPDMQVLELPGPVIVTCRNGRCIGMDQSAHGAAGCALRVLTEIAALDRVCPDLLDRAARDRLAAALDTGWRFWADNTVPRQSHAAALALRDDTIDESVRQMQQICPADGSAHGQDLRQLALSVTRETQAGRIARAFEMPRLPVTNPCL